MKIIFYYTCSCLFIAFILTCCDKTELSKSVYIHDDVYYELPQYSEWGYNTFGAYFDRAAFISNNVEVPMKIIVKNDTTTFIFTGQQGVSQQRNNSYDCSTYETRPKMSLQLQVPGLSPNKYADLLMLSDSTIDIIQSDCVVSVTINGIESNLEPLNGEFIFNSARHLFVDETDIEVILSGTFEFQAIYNDEPVTMSLGRFDVGLGTHNFFNL